MTLKIGDIARLSGLRAKTIRYYESVGLLDAPQRAANGYRVYSDSAVRTLRFVRHARGLGFTLDEVRALLALWQDHQRSSREVKALAEQRMADIDERIAELKRLRLELSNLVSTCHGDQRPECPILDALDPETRGARAMDSHQTTYRVKGMTCSGCARSMTRALENALPGRVTAVSHTDDSVTVHGEHDVKAIVSAVAAAGFVFAGPVHQ